MSNRSLSKVPFQSISLYLQNRLILRRIGIILIQLNVLCTGGTGR